MPDTIRCTVAPGATVTLSPHPSGLRQLGPLTLHAGDVLDLPEAEARRRYAEGAILHPVSGQPRPAPLPSGPSRVTVAIGDAPPQPVPAGSAVHIPDAGTAERADDGKPRRQGPSVELDPLSSALSGAPLPALPDGW